MWHKRLAHASNDSLKSIISSSSFSRNKDSLQFCNACHLGIHIKLPFSKSNNKTLLPFEIIHSDLWTSPVPTLSGIRYYVLFLDDLTHYLWVYPLRRKSEVFSKFLHFSANVKTQFGTQIMSLQCDNGGEYNNSQFLINFDEHGINFRFSCPYTSQQNGKAERMIRTINNAIRTLLFQAQMSPSYWVEALHAAVHVLNILPSASINRNTPHSLLYGKLPTYTLLKVFGCLCFPNINHSNHHKLLPRSTPCLFLGYPLSHWGYRCLDLKTNRIILSRHVIFDESTFPAAQTQSSNSKTYSFLDCSDDTSPIFKSILVSLSLPAAESETLTPAIAHTQPPSTPQTTLPPVPQPQIVPLPTRMTTRGQAGIVKPKKIFTLYASSASRLPTSHHKALLDPHWKPSMTEEYDAQIINKTWRLLPRPPNANVINSLWLYK